MASFIFPTTGTIPKHKEVKMKITDLNNVHYIKLVIGSTIAVLTILLSWNSFYRYNCLSLVFPIIIMLVIGSSFISMKMQERNCYKNCYFKDSSIISKMLSSKISVTIFYVIASVLMSISIMYEVHEFSLLLWLYLVSHIILSIIVFAVLNKVLRNTIHEKFLNIFTRELTINIAAFIFFIVYLYLTINGYEPEYIVEGKSLQETITFATNSISSECLYIDTILRFKIEVDSSFWWLMNNEVVSKAEDRVKVLIWLIFMIIKALVIVGINRFIVQIIYLLNLIFKEKSRDE